MATQLQEIDTVFTGMMTSITTLLDGLYASKKIDPEVYSQVMSSVLSPIMKLATQIVQQQGTVSAQVNKLQKDILHVKKQTQELTSSVTYNNEIKSLSTYADMIGTMGAGGLVPSSNMWTTLFNMIFALNSSAVKPTDTTVTNSNL